MIGNSIYILMIQWVLPVIFFATTFHSYVLLPVVIIPWGNIAMFKCHVSSNLHIQYSHFDVLTMKFMMIVISFHVWCHSNVLLMFNHLMDVLCYWNTSVAMSQKWKIISYWIVQYILQEIYINLHDFYIDILYLIKYLIKIFQTLNSRQHDAQCFCIL